MAIFKDEIEKYIFNPENPKQCKSYKLLLRIAKRENSAFFSPDFLQYFLGKTLLDGSFKDDLWDVPNNYDNLSFPEKVDLYVEQLSQSDLDEYKEQLNDKKLPLYNIFKYNFFNTFIKPSFQQAFQTNILDYINKTRFQQYIKNVLFLTDNTFVPPNPYRGLYSKHFILFSKNYFNILQANIQKSSIFITIEESIDKFLENENNNVKPIFLKKMEDVEILLNVLQKDIQQEKYATNAKEEIATIYHKGQALKNYFNPFWRNFKTSPTPMYGRES